MTTYNYISKKIWDKLWLKPWMSRYSPVYIKKNSTDVLNKYNRGMRKITTDDLGSKVVKYSKYLISNAKINSNNPALENIDPTSFVINNIVNEYFTEDQYIYVIEMAVSQMTVGGVICFLGSETGNIVTIVSEKNNVVQPVIEDDEVIKLNEDSHNWDSVISHYEYVSVSYIDPIRHELVSKDIPMSDLTLVKVADLDEIVPFPIVFDNSENSSVE